MIPQHHQKQQVTHAHQQQTTLPETASDPRASTQQNMAEEQATLELSDDENNIEMESLPPDTMGHFFF